VDLPQGREDMVTHVDAAKLYTVDEFRHLPELGVRVDLNDHPSFGQLPDPFGKPFGKHVLGVFDPFDVAIFELNDIPHSAASSQGSDQPSRQHHQ
jgi:hypothetical protein